MHFAAFAYVPESVADPALYYRNNLAGQPRSARRDARGPRRSPRVLLQLRCLRHTGQRADPRTTPSPPVNPYGETKLAVERALPWYGQAYGLRFVALRYFNAAGAIATARSATSTIPRPRLIPSSCGPPWDWAAPSLRQRLSDPDGTAIRDYIHVEDLAAAHVRRIAIPCWGRSQRHTEPRDRPRPFGARGCRAVERISGRAVPQREAPRRRVTRRSLSPIRRSLASGSIGARCIPIWTRSYVPRLPGRPGPPPASDPHGRRCTSVGTRFIYFWTANDDCFTGRTAAVNFQPVPEAEHDVADAALGATDALRTQPGGRRAPDLPFDAPGPSPNAAALSPADSGEPVRVQGNFFFAGERKHFVRGVTYGPFAPGTHGAQFPERATVERDFAFMRGAGANTVRVFRCRRCGCSMSPRPPG